MLSPAEARSITDEVKQDAERLWRKLVELYEGGAHLALDYSSWESYFRTEFGGSRSQAYRLLDAGRAADALGASVPSSGLKVDQAVALSPLKRDPPALAAAWDEAVERHGEPTAAELREVVAERLPTSRKAEMNANAAKRRIHEALASVTGYCSALPDLNLERALTVATHDDIAAWERLAGDAVRALHIFRRAVKEGKS